MRPLASWAPLEIYASIPDLETNKKLPFALHTSTSVHQDTEGDGRGVQHFLLSKAVEHKRAPLVPPDYANSLMFFIIPRI